jgi:putative ABC transport system ATP-binding protein
MVELFADVAPDSDLFSQYSFISADDLPEFRVLLTKIADGTLAATTDEERASLLALTFRLRRRVWNSEVACLDRVVENRSVLCERHDDSDRSDRRYS